METPKMPGMRYLARWRKLRREVRPPGCAWPDPRGEASEPVPVFVTGGHGEAGTSTAAKMLNALDLGCSRPEPACGTRVDIIAAVRTSAAGLAAASRMLAGYSAYAYPRGAFLTGLVVVADTPGPLP
jgi:hypothetical protein